MMTIFTPIFCFPLVSLTGHECLFVLSSEAVLEKSSRSCKLFRSCFRSTHGNISYSSWNQDPASPLRTAEGLLIMFKMLNIIQISQGVCELNCIFNGYIRLYLIFYTLVRNYMQKCTFVSGLKRTTLCLIYPYKVHFSTLK